MANTCCRNSWIFSKYNYGRCNYIYPTQITNALLIVLLSGNTPWSKETAPLTICHITLSFHNVFTQKSTKCLRKLGAVNSNFICMQPPAASVRTLFCNVDVVVGWTRSAQDQYCCRTVAYSSSCLCQSYRWIFRAQTVTCCITLVVCTLYQNITILSRMVIELHSLRNVLGAGFWITVYE